MITSLNFPSSISWLDRYRSPDYESSLWKGIPIAYRYHPAVLRLIRGDNERGVRLRPRYRGKSKPALGYKRNQSYVTEEFADTFALYPVSNYRAETSLSSRKADTSSMNEPITYSVGNGNVIGSHSAQDFVWAGRAEGSQEQFICPECRRASTKSKTSQVCVRCESEYQSGLNPPMRVPWPGDDGYYAETTGETATHTPADTNTPYAGPITEPVGSDVHFGAEKFGIKGFNQYVGFVATVIGLGGIVGIVLSDYITIPILGPMLSGVSESFKSKDVVGKTLMILTFGSLIYLGGNTTLLSWKFLSNKTIVSG